MRGFERTPSCKSATLHTSLFIRIISLVLYGTAIYVYTNEDIKHKQALLVSSLLFLGGSHIFSGANELSRTEHSIRQLCCNAQRRRTEEAGAVYLMADLERYRLSSGMAAVSCGLLLLASAVGVILRPDWDFQEKTVDALMQGANALIFLLLMIVSESLRRPDTMQHLASLQRQAEVSRSDSAKRTFNRAQRGFDTVRAEALNYASMAALSTAGAIASVMDDEHNQTIEYFKLAFFCLHVASTVQLSYYYLKKLGEDFARVSRRQQSGGAGIELRDAAAHNSSEDDDAPPRTERSSWCRCWSSGQAAGAGDALLDNYEGAAGGQRVNGMPQTGGGPRPVQV